MAHQYGRWRPEDVNEALIRSFVDEHWKEDADLQFKGGKALDPAVTPEKQKRQQNLRDILARYGCAFANAEGGLLVIGVHTEPEPKSGRDMAVSWECTDGNLTAQRIASLLTGVADPPFTSRFLSGVKSDTFDDPDDANRHGCWVLIPKSDDPTHQVMDGAYDGQYLISTQEGVRRIRHDDLVRRLRGGGARLQITGASVLRGSHGHSGSGGAHADFVVGLQVHNAGPGSATELQVEAYVAKPRCPRGATAGFGPKQRLREEWPSVVGQGGYSTRRSPVGETLHEGSMMEVTHRVHFECGGHSPVKGQYVGAYRVKAKEGSSPVVLFGFETERHKGAREPGWLEPAERQRLVQIAEDEIAARVRFALWVPPGDYPYEGEPWPDEP